MTTSWQKPPRGTVLNRSHPLARGLVGCWIFNEGTGGKVFGLSHNRSGTLAGNTSWVAGNDGYALKFDGASGTRVTFPRAAMSSSEGTFVCSVKLDGTSGNQMIIGRLTGDGDNGVDFHWENGVTALALGVKTSAYQAQTKAGDISGLGWHNVAGVWTQTVNDDIELYLDGLLVGSDTVSGAWSFASEDIIMGDALDVFWDELVGKIGYFYIYNYRLSSSKIAWLHREPYAMFEQLSRAKYSDVPGSTLEISVHDCGETVDIMGG